MRSVSVCAAFALITTATTAASCDIGKITVNTTSKVLLRAQPSLQMEADYELARNALPGTLKTVEGFWVVSPDNWRLIRILTEGYCQYGTGFVEDDWEAAKFRKDIEQIDYHNERSTKIFTRCLNYALMTLGPRWQKEIFAEPDTITKLIADTKPEKRFAMMFAGLALGSLVNHNLSRVEMLGNLPTVEAIMHKVIEWDEKTPPANKAHAAMPHIALGMLFSGRAKALGGDPEKAKAAFERALKITDNKMLLPRVLMAYRVGYSNNDQKFFHDNLKLVLETPPSVWPEQRLANEVAHRKARRYLKHEKDLFQ